MREIIVNIELPSDKYLAMYQGIAKNISCRSTDGQRVVFPANILQKYLLHDGINGTFRIVFDDDSKFQEVHKI